MQEELDIKTETQNVENQHFENILEDNTATMNSYSSRLEILFAGVEEALKGKSNELKLITTVLLAGGHILIEDNPGTGKTVMAKTLSQSISSKDAENGLLFKRIQFTPDLLPMDLVGMHLFNDASKDFVFKQGALFCNVLLADEINRASPKVQSALLECMAENQITVGNTTYPLEKLFFVIATQNPIEIEGTYPLPAAQLDRFFMKINFGYIDRDEEIQVYQNYQFIDRKVAAAKPVLSENDIFELRAKAGETYVHDEIVTSIYNIIKATREHRDIALGASPRSGIIFMKCLRAFALVNKRSFVVEDDIARLAHPVLHHRLIFKNRDAANNLLHSIVHKEISRLSRLNLYPPTNV
ncbi:MAG: MoxR family ATPase [Prevotellaceae bacterium]|jgi:MoxR-like ATPase|nr:MoxR family ATPase [Prevotellaceae bacterium]